MTHAATAAVLRSGYLSHSGDELAVDLSSTRVRAALGVLNALREGQSLGAALGYRFERALQDSGLAQFIDAIRQLVPLDVGVLRPVPPRTDVTDVAAMVTTDGLALLELNKRLLWEKLPGASQTERQRICLALDQLRDVADAIADIGVAESVHQLLQRNPMRVAGTLDALTRGELPASDDPDVLRTPRQGTGVTHRLLLVAPDPASDAAQRALERWPASREQRARHVRAAAEPRLNAWAAMTLGDPARVRFRVARQHPVTGDPLSEPREFQLSDVGLCPWDVLAGPSPDVASLAETNLGRRLMRHAEAVIDDRGSRLSLIVDRAESWGAEVLSVPEFLTVAESCRSLVMAARAADARDLRAGAARDSGIEERHLATRLAACRRRLSRAREALRSFFVIETDAQRTALRASFPGLGAIIDNMQNLLDLPATCDMAVAAEAVSRPEMDRAGTLADALDLLSGFGIPDAAARPRTPFVDDEGHRAALVADRATLAVQARAAQSTAEERLGRSAAAEEAGEMGAALEALFGDGFRMLPLFTHGLPASATPTGASMDAVDRWFDGVAMVREGAARLQQVFLGSEIATLDSAQPAAARWDVVQLPAPRPEDPAERWVALPIDPGPPSRIQAGRVSLVASAPLAAWRSSQVAALLIDTWVETVPSAEENTAIAFHLDSPDACAPQAMLLAVAPDPAVSWSWSVLGDLVRETAELAKIRAVSAERNPLYGHLLPALLFAHNVGGVPGGDTIATDFGG